MQSQTDGVGPDLARTWIGIAAAPRVAGATWSWRGPPPPALW